MPIIDLLTAIARVRPEIWDAVNPRQGFRTRVEQVMLNPQPLPPQPPPDAFIVGAAHMAATVVQMAVDAEVLGETRTEFVREWVDDWCATPWPRRWPWPWPGPRPDEGPFPEPWDIASSRAVGAVILASMGSRLADGDLRRALVDGAEQLAEAAVPG